MWIDFIACVAVEQRESDLSAKEKDTMTEDTGSAEAF